MNGIQNSRSVISGSHLQIGGDLTVGDRTVNIFQNADYRQLEEKISTLTDLLKVMAADDIKRREYEQKLNEARRQLADFKQEIIQLAATFSRIDINSERLEKARQLFIDGKFREADAILDLEALKQDQTTLLRREDEAKSVLEKIRSARIQLANEYLVKAQLTATQHQKDSWVVETERLYEESLATFPQTDTYVQYSIFLRRRQQHARAIQVLSDAWQKLEPVHQPAEEAWIKLGLAVLHDETNEPETARQYYEESLRIWEKTDQGPAVDERKVRAMLNMAIFYLRRNSDQPAQSYLNQCLHQIRRLPEQNAGSDELRISIFKNLGIYHTRQREFDKALQYYNKCLALIEKLTQKGAEDFEPYKAEIAQNIGTLYSGEGMPEKGLKYLNKALDIYRKLFVKDPIEYKPMFIGILNDLGNWHNVYQQPDKALEYFSEALPLSRQLEADNTAVYAADLALLLHNIGIVHEKRGAFSEAFSAFTESLRIRRNLSNKDPLQFRSGLASVLNDLGILHLSQGHVNQAIEPFIEAADIYRKLINQDAGAFQPVLVNLLQNLGYSYLNTGNPHEAEKYLTECLRHTEILYQKDPDQFALQLARTNMSMGDLNIKKGAREQAGAYFKKAADAFEILATQNPAAFTSELSGTLNNLANFTKDVKHDYAESERLYARALDLIRNAAKTDPTRHSIDVIRIMVNMASLWLLQWQTTKVPAFKEKALAQCMEAQTLLQTAAGPEDNLTDFRQTLEEMKRQLQA